CGSISTSKSPVLTGALKSTCHLTTVPLTWEPTTTFVVGWIVPVAATVATMSPRSTGAKTYSSGVDRPCQARQAYQPPEARAPTTIREMRTLMRRSRLADPGRIRQSWTVHHDRGRPQGWPCVGAHRRYPVGDCGQGGSRPPSP